MSSPVGHSLAGYVIASYRERSLKPYDIKNLFFYIFMANAPDLDFIPGMLVGQPNLYHHGISHSLGAGILVAALVAFLIGIKRKGRLKRDFFYLLTIYVSHLLLDLISIDGRPLLGIPFFWPLSEAYLMLPLLPPVLHSELNYATFGQFFADVFSTHNLHVVFLEIALTVPFALILRFIYTQSQKSKN